MDPQAVTETGFHRTMEIITVIGVPTIVALVGFILKMLWTSAAAYTELKLTVLNIRDNHLAHIAKDVDEAKSDLKELRGQFVAHIASSKD